MTKNPVITDFPIHIYLGGSFDPVHNSHVDLLTHVYKTVANHNSKVGNQPHINAYFLPTSRSPLKKSSTDPQHRLNMLKLACDNLNHSANPYISKLYISEHELWKAPPTYTVDTLTDLRNIHADTSLIFVIGADSIANLDKWKDGNKLTQLAHLWVIPRDHLQTVEEIIALLPQRLQPQVATNPNDLTTTPSGHIYIDTHKVASISSSQIRAAVALGGTLNLEKAKSALPADVYSYIIKNDLYCS